MLSKINKISISILLFSTLALSNSNTRNSNSNAQKGYSFLYPSEQAGRSQELKQNAYEMNLDPIIADEVARKKDAYYRSIHQTRNMHMSSTAIRKPFQDIDMVYITTEYQTVFIFPQKYFIQKATASEPLAYNSHTENILTIKPLRNFVEGNIVVALSTGKENKVAIINLRKYLSDEFVHREGSSKFENGEKQLSNMIVYVDKAKASNTEILDAYLSLKGDKCYTTFSKDGAFDTIIYQDTLFYVIRDDKYGTIELDGINYTISTQYRSFGETEEEEQDSISFIN